ncbi:hypothetical protein CXB51_021841 [Gossypium anomalum]|uniref:Integrase catalytic domain-containing protein n=1 Tax=Gossypium anomalum TaxID=47600 RepID=A0A8J5YJQ7_9ROSI|nr:hypothetical protein CXB51_021841 [Gossypium anomalum]
MVVIDRLSKYNHFTALLDNFSSKSVAIAFLNDIVRLHGIPTTIFTNRKPRFMHTFWQELYSLQRTKLAISTPYHPQIDSQTEVINKCLEMYLKCFLADTPHAWIPMLPWAKYWYNTAFQTMACMTPFEILYKHPPPTIARYIQDTSRSPLIDEYIRDRDATLHLLKTNLLRAQAKMKAQADKYHCDLVLEAVLQSIGMVAYKLDLLATAKVHHVFHVSLLHKCIGIPDVLAKLQSNISSNGMVFPMKQIVERTKPTCFAVFLTGTLKARFFPNRGIVLSQRKYALELIAEAGLEGAKPVSTPMEQNRRLTTQEYDQCLHIEGGDDLLEDVIAYKRLIGKLLYLTSTRRDIAYSVQYLSQFMQQPKKSHYEAALRIVKYVKKNPGQGFYCLRKSFYI